jgi:hypothetical protein
MLVTGVVGVGVSVSVSVAVAGVVVAALPAVSGIASVPFALGSDVGGALPTASVVGGFAPSFERALSLALAAASSPASLRARERGSCWVSVTGGFWIWMCGVDVPLEFLEGGVTIFGGATFGTTVSICFSGAGFWAEETKLSGSVTALISPLSSPYSFHSSICSRSCDCQFSF